MQAMAPSSFRVFSSYRRQNLLVELRAESSASLKHIRPVGIYVSLTPGDPSLWNGVLFVRKGPYAPAILRFSIKFPRDYPFVPPLVIFNADNIFHPLLSPPTTSYTVDRGASNDDEKLPIGALNLRHGFPLWSNRRRRDSVSFESIKTDSAPQSPNSDTKPEPSQPSFEDQAKDICVAEILRYVRRSFEDETILDNLPLEDAVNPGAWYAWRSYRGLEKPVKESSQITTEARDSPAGRPRQIRRASQWNWEGVWEDRVRKGVRSSLNESTLYGSGPNREEVLGVPFLDAEAEDIKTMRIAMMEYLNITEEDLVAEESKDVDS